MSLSRVFVKWLIPETLHNQVKNAPDLMLKIKVNTSGIRLIQLQNCHKLIPLLNHAILKINSACILHTTLSSSQCCVLLGLM